MSQSNRCPECGAELPASAPRGLCPACLLKRGLETNTMGYSQEAGPSHWTPPGVEEVAGRFPELEVIRLIGRGGMGVVYQARQKSLDRLVALKILPPEMAADKAFTERFAREAQAMAKLNHPHIVTIHEFGDRSGWYYFLMEYVDGVSLRGLLDTGHVSPKEALAIVPQICEALQYAHDQGIVHRDIKPENILLNRQGQVKIADFGLAKLMGLSLPAAEKVMGTPQYMAPEQKERPAEVDHRADIYSLGVVFYQMLTGELPRGGIEPPSRKVQIDVRLDEIVLRALEKEPARRYQQASEVKTEVETLESLSPSEDKGTWKSPTQGWGYLVGRLFGVTFTSPLAYKLANLSALGFLGCLAFLSALPLPGVELFRAFAGLAGLFGLAGFAFVIERNVRAREGGRRDQSRGTMAGRDGSGGPVYSLLRWSARILGSLWAVMLLVFVVGMGSPAMGSQPNVVRLEFAAIGLWLIGMMLGWRFEGMAALLIFLGSVVFHVVEARFPLGWALEMPGVIGLLHAVCWVMSWHNGGKPMRWTGVAMRCAAIMGCLLLMGVVGLGAFVLALPTFDDAVQTALLAQLRTRGATVDQLQVHVTPRPQGGSTAHVTYHGLKGFAAQDGTPVPADGEFDMEYVGAARWEGKLGGTLLGATVGTTDNIDLPFVDDPAVIGDWKSVDFVADPAKFDPAKRQWAHDLFFKELHVLPNGRTPKPWFTWTKGFFLHKGDKTASRYDIRQIQGKTYMFFEWKSGDVTILGRKPNYYVLEKTGEVGQPATQPTSAPADLSHAVPFKPGEERFDHKGDDIVIQEIVGPTDTLDPGKTYMISGTYTLVSHERALLQTWAANGYSYPVPGQTTTVNKGKGTFRLVLPVEVNLKPHVSLYPVEGGQAFGRRCFIAPSRAGNVADPSAASVAGNG